jgi:hypothetical protein
MTLDQHDGRLTADGKKAERGPNESVAYCLRIVANPFLSERARVGGTLATLSNPKLPFLIPDP